MHRQVNSSHSKGEHPSDRSQGLGTFAGVFTPSILTILGIILFLRLGYVTGGAGVLKCLAILAIANLVTIITSQSLSAVATNLKVKGGGDYYLISRTLGYKFGGAIGIVLYLAQSVSVAFYCIGFAEALSTMLPFVVSPQIIAAVAVGLLFILAWLGADYATRFQYVVMLLLVSALASFYIGGVNGWQKSVFLANLHSPEGAPSLWSLFAVFFPAVTGFTQGVSMSGDLREPSRSLPLGTFLAVGLSIVIYLSAILVFAGNLPNSDLMHDFQAMRRTAYWGPLIDAGVVAATLSSAMASFMGGPRILQSLAADRIFPLLTPFEKTVGETNNPRRGVILSCLIAFLTISLGQLNLIAQVVSMFFLISYGLLNYATFYEADSGAPSFRPRFRYFHKYVSLFGALLCLILLLALDLQNGVVALSVLLGVYLYLNHRGQPARWADSSRVHSLSRIRRNLEQVSGIPKHQRDWYPHLLIFTRKRENRQRLLVFGSWLCGEIGLMTGLQVVSSPSRRQRLQTEQELREDIQAAQLFCYGKAVAASDFSSSLPLILQCSGIGPLSPNTVLTNWFSAPDSQIGGLKVLQFGHNLRSAYRLGQNIVIFHCDQSRWETLLESPEKRENIDVWWFGDEKSNTLMLLFAHLVQRNSLWKNGRIRVFSLFRDSRPDLLVDRESLPEIVEDARIEAELVEVSDCSPETVLAGSASSGLVFLPFRIRNSRVTDVNGLSMERVLHQLSAVAMVKGVEELDLGATPEEGTAGELARCLDELNETAQQINRLKAEEEKMNALLDKLSGEIRQEAEKLGEELSSEHLQHLQKQQFEAEKRKEKTFRKIAKLQARYDDLADTAEGLGQAD